MFISFSSTNFNTLLFLVLILQSQISSKKKCIKSCTQQSMISCSFGCQSCYARQQDGDYYCEEQVNQFSNLLILIPIFIGIFTIVIITIILVQQKKCNQKYIQQKYQLYPQQSIQYSSLLDSVQNNDEVVYNYQKKKQGKYRAVKLKNLDD